MDSSKLALLFVILLALFGGIWLIFDESEPPVKPHLPEDGTEQRAEAAAAATEVLASDASLQESAAPEEGKPERRSPLGRTVLVTDADGTPLQQVRVDYVLSNEKRWLIQLDDIRNNLAQVRALDFERFRAEGKSKTTDAGGLVDLPLEGIGIVGSDNGHACNLEMVEEYQEGVPQQVVLKLVPYPSLAVKVLHADGSPAQGYTTKLSGVSRARSHGEDESQVDWMPLRTSAPTDDNGETRLRLGVNPILDLYKEHLDNPVFRVAVSTANGEVAGQRVDLNRAKSVELRIPENGVIQIHLQGFPESMHPRLDSTSMENGRMRFPSPMKPVEGQPADGKWIFKDIPLGHEFSTSIHQWDPSGDGTSQSTRFDSRQHAGPTKAGETVPIVFHYLQDARLSAKLTSADGTPLDKTMDTAGVSAWIWHPPNYITAHGLSIEVGSNGSLVAKAPTSKMPGQLDVPFSRVILTYDPFSFGDTLRSGPKQFLFADVELPPSKPGEPYDLGDVAMAPVDDLLTVRISDPNGNPVPRVETQIEYLHRWGTGDRRREAWTPMFNIGERLGHATDGMGSLQFPSWRYLCNINKAYRPDRVDENPEEFKLLVNHPDYQKEVIPFGPDRKHIDVRLKAGARLSGGILKSERYTNMIVGAVKPGTTYLERVPKDVLARGGGRGYSSRWEKLRSIPFELGNLEPGLHDIVFFSSNEGAEVHRITGVNLAAGDNAPAVMQDVDLRPYLDYVEIEILDEQGHAIRQQQLNGMKIRVMRYAPDLRSGSGAGFIFLNDRIVVDIPKGGVFNGKVEVEGYREFVFRGVEAGIHSKQLSKFATVRFQLANRNAVLNDARLSLYLRSAKGRFAESMKTVQGNPGIWSGPCEGPGEYLLHIGRSDGITVRTDPVPLTLTAEQLDTSFSIVVEIPAAVIQSFSD
jgi:hypothetical protein